MLAFLNTPNLRKLHQVMSQMLRIISAAHYRISLRVCVISVRATTNRKGKMTRIAAPAIAASLAAAFSAEAFVHQPTRLADASANARRRVTNQILRMSADDDGEDGVMNKYSR